MMSLFWWCKRLSSALTVMCFIPVIFGAGSSAAAVGEIPRCRQILGSVALTDPNAGPDKEMWWSRYSLAAPSQLLSKVIEASGCFRVVPAGQNPDYILTGDVAQRQFISGENKNAIFVSINSTAADVSLSLNFRAPTGKSVRTVGHGEFSRLRYGRGGGISILATPDPKLDSYASSMIGQLVTLGFIRAYIDLVRQLQGDIPARPGE